MESLVFVKNINKVIYTKRFHKEFSVSKVNGNHYLYATVKRGKRRVNIFHKRLTIYSDLVLGVSTEIKERIETVIRGHCMWVKQLPFKMVSYTQIKQKKISSLEDMYHKMYNFIPKKLFFKYLNNEESLKILLLSRQTDVKSVKFLENPRKVYQIDCIKMAWTLKQPINVNWSILKWKEKHDEYARLANNLALIQANSINFKRTEEFTIFHKWFTKQAIYKDYDFRALTTSKELLEEGIRQNHCVAGYTTAVQQGYCLIYTCEFDSQPCTVEIRKWECNQAMFKFNRTCPSIKILLNTLCNEFKSLNLVPK